MTTKFGRQRVAAKTRGSSFTIVKMGTMPPSPPVECIVDLQPNDSAMGHTIGSGTYPAGTAVEARAIAHDGYVFIRWSDGSTNATRQLVVSHDISLVAYFGEAPHVGVMEYISNKDHRN